MAEVDLIKLGELSGDLFLIKVQRNAGQVSVPEKNLIVLVFECSMWINPGMYEQSVLKQVVVGCLLQEYKVFARHPGSVRFDGCLASLVEPDGINEPRLHPLACPPVVVAQDVREVVDLEEFVNAILCVWPSITNIPQADQVIIFVIKPRPLQALAQGEACTVDITNRTLNASSPAIVWTRPRAPTGNWSRTIKSPLPSAPAR